MNEIDTLTKQTKDAYYWLNKMIDSVQTEKWDEIAEGIDSNISWQVGHQIVSIYYHSIMTTVGHISEVIEKADLKNYTKICSFDTSPADMVGKTKPKLLLEHLVFMQQKSIDVLKSLSEKELKMNVESTKMPHPVAKTKFEALDWNIKHVMWHCGQIATIKRIVDVGYDFGLRKTK